MIKEKMEQLDAEAAKTKMSSENYYKGLKKTGLTHFKVEVPTGKIYYYAKDESYVEQEPMTFKVSKIFNKKALAEAFEAINANKLNYLQFKEAVAKAGGHHYLVELAKDTNTFYNEDESEVLPIKITFAKK